MRQTRAALAALLCATALAGCDTVRDWAGLAKKSPDEFAVTTKAPLVIPPDFNLRPPLPGAPPTNALEPSDSAQQALFAGNADPQTVASHMRGNFTPAEKLLLAHAGAQKADPAVRVKLTSDWSVTQQANRSFTDKVLGTTPTPFTGQAINPDAEIAKRSGAKTTSVKKKSGGGWFDWF
jgi:hypothetical protein